MELQSGCRDDGALVAFVAERAAAVLAQLPRWRHYSALEWREPGARMEEKPHADTGTEGALREEDVAGVDEAPR